MPAKVALTGGIGSGKTTVGNLFRNLGILVIDADEVARKVTAIGTPALKRIEQHFGEQCINEDGSLNRQALGRQVFQSTDERKWLEQLLHPLIRRESDDQAAMSEGPYCILEIPLLLETNRHLEMDAVIVVHCEQQIRLSRLIENRNMDPETVNRVFDSQASDEARLEIADYVVNNTTSPSDLPDQVKHIHQQLLERFH